MNDLDKKTIVSFFIRVMANQSLILSALASITQSPDISKKLQERAEQLANELAEAASELIKP